MKKWLRLANTAIGTALIWGFGWACVGMLIELIHNIRPNAVGALVDIWPTTLAIPGLIAGFIFLALLRLLERRRQRNEWSLAHLAAAGGAAGLLLSLIAASVGISSAVFPDLPATVVIGAMTLLGALSAMAWTMIIRYASQAEIHVEAEG